MMLFMKWSIRNVKIKNQIVLAPMAGISNPSYMKICEEMGIGYAITELISAEAIVRNNKKTLEMLNGIETLKIPIAVQIFGAKPDTIAKAAKILTDLYQIRLIERNLGYLFKLYDQNIRGEEKYNMVMQINFNNFAYKRVRI